MFPISEGLVLGSSTIEEGVNELVATLIGSDFNESFLPMPRPSTCGQGHKSWWLLLHNRGIVREGNSIS